MPLPLSPSAIALLCLVAWPLLLMLIIENQRGLLVLTRKMAVNAFAPDGSNTPSAFGRRLARAHANCLENLPLQATPLLYALAVEQTALTDPLALWLLGARLFQSSMHLISTSPLFVWLRFAGFLLQQLIIAWWLLRLSGLV